jgi:hypothetical protein
METLIGGLVLAAVFVVVLYGTRKRPGKRYDKKPPSEADADIDNWWSA